MALRPVHDAADSARDGCPWRLPWRVLLPEAEPARLYKHVLVHADVGDNWRRSASVVQHSIFSRINQNRKKKRETGLFSLREKYADARLSAAMDTGLPRKEK